MADELVAPPSETAVPASQPETVSSESDVKPVSSTGPADTAAEPPKKKGGGFQKRIDKLTRTVYELQAELEATKATKATVADDKEPKRDDFDDLESYQRSLAEHTAKRVIKEYQTKEDQTRRQAQSRSEQAKRVQAWETHVEKAGEKYDDAEDVLEHFSSEVTLHPYALDAIIESEIGYDIAYYLGKHDAEVAKISKLSPSRQASEIGKLEVRLTDAPKKVSSAPAPIDPVKGKGAAETGLSPDLPIGEWIKRRNKQLRGG